VPETEEYRIKRTKLYKHPRFVLRLGERHKVEGKVSLRKHFYELDNCWELHGKTKLSPLLLKSGYRLGDEDTLFENTHTV